MMSSDAPWFFVVHCGILGSEHSRRILRLIEAALKMADSLIGAATSELGSWLRRTLGLYQLAGFAMRMIPAHVHEAPPPATTVACRIFIKYLTGGEFKHKQVFHMDKLLIRPRFTPLFVWLLGFLYYVQVTCILATYCRYCKSEMHTTANMFPVKRPRKRRNMQDRGRKKYMTEVMLIAVCQMCILN